MNYIKFTKIFNIDINNFISIVENVIKSLDGKLINLELIESIDYSLIKHES